MMRILQQMYAGFTGERTDRMILKAWKTIVSHESVADALQCSALMHGCMVAQGECNAV